MDKNNYFPTWLEEFNRFKALKSEFFLYGNIYDCYYFPINYKTATNSDELKFAKFNDIKELLKKFLKEEGYDIITYFDIIDGLEVGEANETNPKYTLDNLANSGVEKQSADFSKNLERARLGNPDAATVGRPGTKGEGCAVVTASARSRPALTCCVAEPALGNISWTCNAITAFSAGPLPL